MNEYTCQHGAYDQISCEQRGLKLALVTSTEEHYFVIYLSPVDARAFAADIIAACDQIEGEKL